MHFLPRIVIVYVVLCRCSSEGMGGGILTNASSDSSLKTRCDHTHFHALLMNINVTSSTTRSVYSFLYISGGREEGWVREFEQHRQEQSEEW